MFISSKTPFYRGTAASPLLRLSHEKVPTPSLPLLSGGMFLPQGSLGPHQIETAPKDHHRAAENSSAGGRCTALEEGSAFYCYRGMLGTPTHPLTHTHKHAFLIRT